MLEQIIAYIEPTRLLVLITFFIGVAYCNPHNKNHKLLLLVITVSFLTEVIATIVPYQRKVIGLTYTISATLHHGLWLLILRKNIQAKKAAAIGLAVFLAFSCINLVLLEGANNFNYNTFIAGAFIYIALFIYDSFYQLKKENFPFFLSNTYLLLFAPVLFFFGLSFVFGFKSPKLAATKITDTINLYEFTGYLVNLVYYSLIILYIYREKRVKNAG